MNPNEHLYPLMTLVVDALDPIDFGTFALTCTMCAQIVRERVQSREFLDMEMLVINPKCDGYILEKHVRPSVIAAKWSADCRDPYKNSDHLRKIWSQDNSITFVARVLDAMPNVASMVRIMQIMRRAGGKRAFEVFAKMRRSEPIALRDILCIILSSPRKPRSGLIELFVAQFSVDHAGTLEQLAIEHLCEHVLPMGCADGSSPCLFRMISLNKLPLTILTAIVFLHMTIATYGSICQQQKIVNICAALVRGADAQGTEALEEQWRAINESLTRAWSWNESVRVDLGSFESAYAAVLGV